MARQHFLTPSARAAAGHKAAAPRNGSRFLAGPFAYPEYRRFWLGGLLAFTGFWLQLIARSWLIQEMTGSPLLVSLVPVTMLLPMLVLSLPAGVAADRFNRRGIVLGAEIAAFFGYATLAAIVVLGAVQVWHILALSTVTGSMMAFSGPSRMAAITGLVPPNQTRRAIALSSMIFNLAQIIGPAIGGLLIKIYGVEASLISALFFSVPAIALYMSARGGESRRIRDKGASALNDIKDGLNYTFSNPVLRKLLVSALVVIVTFTAWGALLPTFSMDVLGGDASALGFLTLATGAGALIGSLVVVYAGPRFEHGKLSVGLVVLLALSVTGFALSQSLLLSLLFALLAGVFQTAYMVINMTLTQLAANEQFRGRVISIRFLVVGLQPIGALSLGIAAEYAGPQVALGGLVAVGLLAFFTLPHFLPRLLQRKSSIAGRQPLALASGSASDSDVREG